jgi:hypothetical protein
MDIGPEEEEIVVEPLEEPVPAEEPEPDEAPAPTGGVEASVAARARTPPASAPGSTSTGRRCPPGGVAEGEHFHRKGSPSRVRFRPPLVAPVKGRHPAGAATNKRIERIAPERILDRASR